MSLPVSFTLDASGLRPFTEAWRSASASLRDGTDGRGVAHQARRRFAELTLEDVPGFVRQRLGVVPVLADWLCDARWPLPGPIMADVAGALVYFSDQCDLIPDANPRFGLLDDAVVIELALREQRDEWLAWLAFDAARMRHPELGDLLDREGWLGLSERQRLRLYRAAAPARELDPAALAATFRVH